MRKKVTRKKSRFGADLIEGMKLVVAHQRGDVELEQAWPKPMDVKAIRKRVKMSQAEFSRAYGISNGALQEWEQGGRQPYSAARVSHRHCQGASRRSPRPESRMTEEIRPYRDYIKKG
jgi:putative transcriptional regulator